MWERTENTQTHTSKVNLEIEIPSVFSLEKNKKKRQMISLSLTGLARVTHPLRKTDSSQAVSFDSDAAFCIAKAGVTPKLALFSLNKLPFILSGQGGSKF